MNKWKQRNERLTNSSSYLTVITNAATAHKYHRSQQQQKEPSHLSTINTKTKQNNLIWTTDMIFSGEKYSMYVCQTQCTTHLREKKKRVRLFFVCFVFTVFVLFLLFRLNMHLFCCCWLGWGGFWAVVFIGVGGGGDFLHQRFLNIDITLW